MKDRLKNTKDHLKKQIKTAKQLDSKWVYILVSEAEKCLELAEAEDTLLMNPVPSEIEGGGHTWWYVCGDCHGSLDPSDSYCKHCGRKIKHE